MRTVCHFNGTVGEVIAEQERAFMVRVCASPDHGVETREERWPKMDVLKPDGWARITPGGMVISEYHPERQAAETMLNEVVSEESLTTQDAADPETVDTSGTDGMIPADVLDLVDDATLCAIRIASAKGEFGEAGKTAIREAFAIRHDDLDAELDVDGDRVSRTTRMLFHVTAEHARTLDGEAR